jgi:hypothetical protein
VLDALDTRLGRFDPAAALDGSAGMSLHSSDSYQRWLATVIGADLAEAVHGFAGSPVKGALDVLRDLREQFRYVVDFGGLTPESGEDFATRIVPALNRAVVQAVNVGRSIDPNVQAILVSDDPEQATAIKTQWERQLPDVPLVIVESPYRALVAPHLSYLDVLDRAWPADKEAPITFVVIPEYVARSWWERILYNQSAKRLRQALLGRPHTVVVNVPYRREASDVGDRPGRGDHTSPGAPPPA